MNYSLEFIRGLAEQHREMPMPADYEEPLNASGDKLEYLFRQNGLSLTVETLHAFAIGSATTSQYPSETPEIAAAISVTARRLIDGEVDLSD